MAGPSFKFPRRAPQFLVGLYIVWVWVDLHSILQGRGGGGGGIEFEWVPIPGCANQTDKIMRQYEIPVDLLFYRSGWHI